MFSNVWCSIEDSQFEMASRELQKEVDRDILGGSLIKNGHCEKVWVHAGLQGRCSILSLIFPFRNLIPL